ncbi:hypothetical protein B0H13DRAFT_1886062 [Mycena leptocephala]|nr:hypothetical protein B0H13DRAFT_1886062 [Mycena leptocephala]
MAELLRPLVTGCDTDICCEKIMIPTLAKQVFSGFGDAMQKNPKHTTPEVKEAYNALDNKAKKNEAKRLKQLKKAADKPDVSGDADRVNIQRKDSCTSQLGCAGPKEIACSCLPPPQSPVSSPSRWLNHGYMQAQRTPIDGKRERYQTPMASLADLKHGDEVMRDGGISHLAAQIKGEAARGASHGVMDIEDVHESEAYVRCGTGSTAKKDSEVKITFHRHAGSCGCAAVSVTGLMRVYNGTGVT